MTRKQLPAKKKPAPVQDAGLCLNLKATVKVSAATCDKVMTFLTAFFFWRN